MSNTISLSNLEEYVNGLEESGSWEAEFNGQGRCDAQVKSMTAAQLPENIVKHRYSGINLGAYDETRVILSRMPGESESDYINANWIDGYKGKRRYIVTQAPLHTTLIDFYRMIWDTNVIQIVMLASNNDVEQNKCIAYYPAESMTFGEIEVTLERTSYHGDIVRRIYSIKKGTVIRPLVHYHYTAWPDLGVPENPGSILRLIQMYKLSDTFSAAYPLLVHCSAGVGRTGSFLLADIVYDMAEDDGVVDFLGTLCLLRKQRISMVEKPEQYFLAHKVILLASQSGLFKQNRCFD